MYVEGVSLGYIEMGILSGLRTFACEGRSNCGMMFNSGGDKCAVFAALNRVKTSADLTIITNPHEILLFSVCIKSTIVVFNMAKQLSEENGGGPFC